MDLNREIGKKKNVYPSKKTINLCYEVETSTKVSSALLRIVFLVVVLIAALKFLVMDILIERNEALAQLERLQSVLDQQLIVIQDFDKVAEEYSRYSYKILIDELGTQDRLDILAMLEETVFKDGEMSNVSISGNAVTLAFSGLNLDECAQLIADIQAYEMVDTVVISNQTGSEDGTYNGNLSIMLKEKSPEINAGGVQ